MVFKGLRRRSYEDFRLGGVPVFGAEKNDMFEVLKAGKTFVLEESREATGVSGL